MDPDALGELVPEAVVDAFVDSWATRWGSAVAVRMALPMDYEEWVKLGEHISAIHSELDRARTTALLALGDWLVYGREAVLDPRLPREQRIRYEERYSQAASVSGLDPDYLYNLCMVCSRWTSRRRFRRDGTPRWPSLTIGHLQAVTSLDRAAPRYAARLLDAAEEKGWTRDQIRSAAAEMRKAAGIPEKGAAPDLEENAQDPMVALGAVDIPTAVEALQQLFLLHSPEYCSRRLFEMPDSVWETIVTHFLGVLNIRSHNDERRTQELAMGPGPSG
jgi:hypothetical protein